MKNKRQIAVLFSIIALIFPMKTSFAVSKAESTYRQALKKLALLKKVRITTTNRKKQQKQWSQLIKLPSSRGNRVVRAFRKVLKLKKAHWSLCALYQIGQTFDTLAKIATNIPAPKIEGKTLGRKLAFTYKSLIANKFVRPFRTQAVLVYGEVVKKSKLWKRTGKCVDSAQKLWKKGMLK